MCLDRLSGKVLWRQVVVEAPMEKKHRLNSHASSTPATDGKSIYVSFLDGVTTIVRPGPEFDLVATNDLGEACRASPAISQGRSDFLKRPFRQGHLRFFGKLECYAESAQFEQLVDASVRHQWVVYAKRPFGRPTQVLKYLARHTHRVAISNKRVLDLRDGQVRFQYKDYADGNKTKAMTLDAVEFIRRFLMHVLPSGFMRIRHYGFLGNRHRQAKLKLCRRLLEAES
ncbi:MAG: transposase [Planctomycetia bacterium]|nr:transposase [Planctomycetia bacterium]